MSLFQQLSSQAVFKLPGSFSEVLDEDTFHVLGLQ
jgi:hypothetical protein